MKYLIFILSIIVLGISSCEKTALEPTIDIDQITQNSTDEHVLSSINQKSNNNFVDLPMVGDQVTLQFHSVPWVASNVLDVATVTYLKQIPSGYQIKFGDSSKKLGFNVSFTQAGYQLQQCNDNVINFFASDIGNGKLSHKNIPGVDGIYDSKPNGGCSLQGIYDLLDPSCTGTVTSCPIVKPKLIFFNTESEVVLFIHWN